MSGRILYERPDGGVSIVCPAQPYDERTGTGTKLTIQEIAAKDVPLGVPYRIVDSSELPTDRTFRNAWVMSGIAVAVDMTKAREVHREHLRVLRAPVLAALDIAFLRAIEAGDVPRQAEIAAQKEALRTVTDDPAIDAATTPDELKAVIPEILRRSGAVNVRGEKG